MLVRISQIAAAALLLVGTGCSSLCSSCGSGASRTSEMPPVNQAVPQQSLPPAGLQPTTQQFAPSASQQYVPQTGVRTGTGTGAYGGS